MFYFKRLLLCKWHTLIHDVNPSQLGEAQCGAFRRSSKADLVWLREALLAARRGPVVHRATRHAVPGVLNHFTVDFQNVSKRPPDS